MAYSSNNRKSIPERELKGDSRLYVAQSKLAPEDMKLEPHRHAFYEIALLEEGDGNFICDMESYDLQQGALVCVTPGQVHTWHNPNPHNLILIGFKPTIFASNGINPMLLSQLPYFDKRTSPTINIPTEKQSVFSYLFDTIYERYHELGIFNGSYIELHTENEQVLIAYLHLILIEAARMYDIESTHEPQTAHQQLTLAFYDLLENVFHERWQVRDYANELNVTPNYLNEVIRQATGRPPSDIVQQRLLVEAQRLLVYSDLPVTTISDELSFKSASQFVQWFRRLTDITPKTFRDNSQIL